MAAGRPAGKQPKTRSGEVYLQSQSNAIAIGKFTAIQCLAIAPETSWELSTALGEPVKKAKELLPPRWERVAAGCRVDDLETCNNGALW